MVEGRLPVETSDSELASDLEPVKPVIKQTLPDTTVKEGDQVVLECIITGQPEPEVIWYHDDKPVKESADLQLLFQGDTCCLVVKEAYPEDAGTYRVVAINSAGEASCQCALKVEAEKRVPPKFLKLPTDLEVREGETIHIETDAIGDPKPSIAWHKDGQDLLPSDNVHLSEDLLTLTVKKATMGDGGVYMGIASNSAGEARCFSIVKVLPPVEERKTPVDLSIPPAFIKLFTDKRVKRGDPATYTCIISGKPLPEVSWYLNDVPIARFSEIRVSVENTLHSLTIPECSHVHQGKITCVAGNDAGWATCVGGLIVAEIPKEPSVERVPPEKEESLIVRKAVCMKATDIITNTTHEHVSEGILRQPDKEKAGIMDIIENSVVEELSIDQKKAFVQKMSDLDKGKKPPRFLQPLTGITVTEGDRVLLQGIIEGVPEPSVEWYKNGMEVVVRSDLHVRYDGGKVSLIFDKASSKDSGRYTCNAWNIAGSASSTADLVIQASTEHTGKYTVKARNTAGEAQCVADILVQQPLLLNDVSSSSIGTKIIGQSKAWREETRMRAGFSGLRKPSPMKPTVDSSSDLETFPELEPFPFKPAPVGKPKPIRVSSPPTPKKFYVKALSPPKEESPGPVTIPPKWIPPDSDSEDIPTYRKVNLIPEIQETLHSVSANTDAWVRSISETLSKDKSQEEYATTSYASSKSEVIVNEERTGIPRLGKTVPFDRDTPTWVSHVSCVSSDVETSSVASTDGSKPRKSRIGVKEIKEKLVRQASLESPGAKPPELIPGAVRLWPPDKPKVPETPKETKTPQPRFVEPLPTLEPFPFEPEKPRFPVEMGAPPPKPKKFIPGKAWEDRQSSGDESRIPVKWAPSDSETEEPMYRRVRAPTSPSPKQHHDAEIVKKPSVTSPPPSLEREEGGPVEKSLAPPQFQPFPQETEMQAEIPHASEVMGITQALHVTHSEIQSTVKPLPVSAKQIEESVSSKYSTLEIGRADIREPAEKPFSPTKFTSSEGRTDTPTCLLSDSDSLALEPGSPPELSYTQPPPIPTGTPSASPYILSPYRKNLEIQTSRVTLAESTKFSSRFVTQEQTRKSIHFPQPEWPLVNGKKDYQEDSSDLEWESQSPWSWKSPGAKVQASAKTSGVKDRPLSPMIPRKVPPKTIFDGKRPSTRPVLRGGSPPVLKSKPETPTKETYALSDTETLVKPSYKLPRPRLSRVQDIRKMFNAPSEPPKDDLAVAPYSATFPSIEKSKPLVLQPGSPPEYAYVERKTATAAKHFVQSNFDDMSQTFRTKTEKFAQQIVEDVWAPEKKEPKEKAAGKTTEEVSIPTGEDTRVVETKHGEIEQSEAPQVYREETRTVDFGTKHVDPDSGLIYFKYDFGYEFGILTPGKGGVRELPPPEEESPSIQREGDIEMPIIHIKTKKGEEGRRHSIGGEEARIGRRQGQDFRQRKPWSEGEMSESELEPHPHSRPLFRPKRFMDMKAARWQPTSESEMSDLEADRELRTSTTLTNPSSQSSLSALESLKQWRPWSPPSPQNDVPVFTTRLTDQAAAVGSDVKLECCFASGPDTEVKWFRNGLLLVPSLEYEIIFSDGKSQLTIHHLKPGIDSLPLKRLVLLYLRFLSFDDDDAMKRRNPLLPSPHSGYRIKNSLPEREYYLFQDTRTLEYSRREILPGFTNKDYPQSRYNPFKCTLKYSKRFYYDFLNKDQ
ncbi:unnamed protein product [Darwinula stevensoni]|uniref:Ig-like domain-containing protein n=1 Tax=Darwinula stevensoni TaxID=69355 RepID=A0A7R8ZXK4_9CRUS|nr:unnamed protein product [Darwinula stevensoni]CAG0878667.1 unnamed protein product [Darwinula stevensoni]